MPLSLKIIDGIVAFLLRYVLKYRLNVIRDNLSASFDDQTESELDRNIKNYYLHLAAILRQVLVKPTRKRLERKMNLAMSLALDQRLREEKSVIVTFGHVGNWEWTGSYLGMKYPDKVCALYKKIKTPWINKLMYNRRSSHVNHLIEIKQMGELFRLIKSKPVFILMISDQNPGSDQGIFWVPFLKRLTAFVNGPESLALRYQLPVVYMHPAPRADGGYDLACQPLYDGQAKVESGEITRRYAEALENNITAFRSHWLWSHKRWKRNKT